MISDKSHVNKTYLQEKKDPISSRNVAGQPPTEVTFYSINN
jgi:hypothetical protein